MGLEVSTAPDLVVCSRLRDSPTCRLDNREVSMNRVEMSPSDELLVVEDGAMQRDGRLHAFEHELLERATAAGERLRAVFPAHDELGQQRVVVRGNDVVAIDVQCRRGRPARRGGAARRSCPGSARTSRDLRR